MPQFTIKKILMLLATSSLCCVANSAPTSQKVKSGDSPETKSTSLFDGKTFRGWKTVVPNNKKFWSIVDGVITANNGGKKMPTNTYLATEKQYKNFEFSCKFRLTGDHNTGFINAGIQYRSTIQGHKIIGYQADIGKGYWGNIWDEHRRGELAKGNTTELFKTFKEEDWASYKIVCKGNDHKLYINDLLIVSYTEKQTDIPNSGVIALQLHSGGDAKIEYKDIFVKEL